MNRDAMLEAVRSREKPWDVIVIGGGATGAGCCLDAASRGLDVLLVEQSDFGKGTSSRSTKLIHGGVRYLEQGNLALVREALLERGRLLENAPDHVFKQEFIVPCYSYWSQAYYGLGLKIYDWLSGKRSFGKSAVIGREAAIESLPGITTNGLRGGVRYFDGRFDDTKLLIDIVRTSVSHGACVLNYARVDSFQTDDSRRITGVRFDCTETGEYFEPRAKSVINATGAFSDSIRKKSNVNSKELITCSQGIHLVFSGEFPGSKAALMIPKTSDGRVLFAIPFYGRVLVGTTDTPVKGPQTEPVAVEEEIEFILDTCSQYFEKPPGREDIKSMFAGIRPLIANKDAKNTAALSRGHMIEVDKAGLITVAGGKWTTYRNMAEDAVNRAVSAAGVTSKKSITAGLPLRSAETFDQTGFEERLSPAFEWTKADVIRSVRFEMARTLEDVLARRTRILFLDAKEAIRIASVTAELMASELERSDEWAEQQVAQFTETARAYLGQL